MTETFDPFKAVQDFYMKAGTEPSEALAYSLILEEAKEVHKAAESLLKELCDLQYVLIGALIHKHVKFPQEVNEAIAKVHPLYGLVGEDILNEAFKRVHESNMSKFDGGTMRDNETGKILKSPHYKAPDLSDLV